MTRERGFSQKRPDTDVHFQLPELSSRRFPQNIVWGADVAELNGPISLSERP